MLSARKKKTKPATLGHRGGTKRRDMRWISPNGEVFDSKYEYEVYTAAKQALLPVRRTTKGGADTPGSDTLSYWHPVRGGSCRSCGGADTGTLRSYTADILYDTDLLPARSESEKSKGERSRYYVDAKGYLRANKRSLLRSLVKARKDIDLRFILQRDFKVSPTSNASAWIRRYLKAPYAIWDGKWPTEWIR